MCGIIGITGTQEASPRLVESLRRLEYRGYDSAGICTLLNGALDRRRAKGKLTNLEAVLRDSPLPGVLGIGHTRWATHGAPEERNAHPHITDRVALVHNGIIENFKQLRERMLSMGRVLESETDTELVAHLITVELDTGKTPIDAVKATLKQLHGAFALAIIFKGEESLMIGARRGSPLVVGYGDGEMYLGSDAIALATLTNRICYLEEGDWAVLHPDSAQIFDADDKPVTRAISISSVSGSMIDKGNYRHYMQKEIYEQPTVVAQTLNAYIDRVKSRILLPKMPCALADIKRITLVACGTSYYSSMVAKYWIEQLARIPVDLDIASEFRYRAPVLESGGLAIFVSQSGETADTLEALRLCKAQHQHTAAIVNVMSSSMAREADVVLPTYAGPEISVASTKAFTCQLSVLGSLAIALGMAKGTISADESAHLINELAEAPRLINDALSHDDAIAQIAPQIAKARDVLYLGRGPDYPVALEGALKLKEISYIHAEGYAAGELKHGPIALIDENVPIIVIAPSGPLFEKTISNMQEVIARSGKVLLMSDARGIAEHGDRTWMNIEMPTVETFIAPMIYSIPVQLLAYHTAIAKGTDVDQPRNLAKSVTVE